MSFISKDLLKAFKNKLDDAIKLKGLLEIADGFIIGFGIDYLDDNFSDKVPVEYQDELVTLMLAFVNDDYQGMLDAGSGSLNELVNIPFMEENVQAKFIATNVVALKNFIVWIAKKKQAE